MNKIKIAISGHRNLIDPDGVRKNIALSFQYFKEINQDIIAISALAAGADTIFAQEANKLGITVRYVLPFALEDYKKDFQPNELIALERLLTKNNRQYEIVAPLSDSSKATRNEAYLAVGKRLVDECDVLIAVWDGQDAQGKGGTGDIVAYARTQGKPVHIVKGIRESNQPQDEAHNEYARLDKEAVKYKKSRFIPAWIAGITISILAVFCFAVSLNFKEVLDHEVIVVLAFLEVIFLGLSSILLLYFAKKWKDRFLLTRRDAEYLRTINWYKDAEIPLPIIAKPHYKISDRIALIEQKVTASIPHLGNFANAKRIAWNFAKEQTDYHKGTRIEIFEHKLKLTEKVLNAIKVLFILCIGVKFILELAELTLHWQVGNYLNYLNAALIILPALYAASEGVMFFSDWERNISISESKIEKLKNSCQDIMEADNEDALLKETADLRQILEIENSDWAKRYEKKIVDFKFF